MKLKTIFFAVLLFSGLMPSILLGQPAMQKLFPRTASSILMFQEGGIPHQYYQSYYQSNNWPEIKQLKRSMIPYSQKEYYLTMDILKMALSNGQMQLLLQKKHLQTFLIKQALNRRVDLSPLALPTIYMPQPEVTYTFATPAYPLHGLGLREQFVFKGDRRMAFFTKKDYVYLHLVQNLYYSNPGLVKVHIDALPDPPKLKKGPSGDHRVSQQSLADLFKRESPDTPTKIDKVQLMKLPWRITGSENLQISQTYLKNWVKGGVKSYALLSDLRVKALYEDVRTQWENNLIHKLGYMFLEGGSSGVNDDLVDLTSKYGISASKNWYYSFLFNMKTQLFYGYDKRDVERKTPISGFMAPGYFTLAVGMDFKKGKNFTLMISPVTSKLTLVSDTAKIDQTRYNIPADKRSMFLTGASLYNNLVWQITKEIKFTSAANVFYDYFKEEDQVQADWDMILDMRINVFLGVRMVTNLKYYENESPDVQVRETMSIAFRYNF